MNNKIIIFALGLYFGYKVNDKLWQLMTIGEIIK